MGTTLFPGNDENEPQCNPVSISIKSAIGRVEDDSENKRDLMSVVRLLVVDDVECWRRCLISLLQTEAQITIVGEASDGVEAVQMAEKMQPCMVLLDVGLPRLNGLKAGAWIRKIAPHAKLLFVSHESDPDIVSAAFQLGALGYILKSDVARELVVAIRSSIRGEKFLSDGLKKRINSM